MSTLTKHGVLENAPSHETVLQWALKVGLWALTKPKSLGDDWYLIIDHVVQLGNKKAFVVTGIQHKHLATKDDFTLTTKDLQVFDIRLMENANSDSILQALEEVTQRSGIIPKYIISDHGSEIKKGISLFCQKHHTVKAIYDITHKAGTLYKRYIGNDPFWEAFIAQVGNSKKILQQTSLAELIPPSLRSKPRFLNIDIVLKWGKEILAFIEQGKADDLVMGKLG
jgi:hypothetical protein